MRSREQILNIKGVRKPIVNPDFDMSEVVELLLDIRDLLANPKIQKDFGAARDALHK